MFIASFSILCKHLVMLSLFVDFDIENYTWLIKYCGHFQQKYHMDDIIIATAYDYLFSSCDKQYRFILYNLWTLLWLLARIADLVTPRIVLYIFSLLQDYFMFFSYFLAREWCKFLCLLDTTSMNVSLKFHITKIQHVVCLNLFFINLFEKKL